MRTPKPVTLEGHGVRLEPLDREHHDGLVAAARDGELWNLWFTSVPEPAAVGTIRRIGPVAPAACAGAWLCAATRPAPSVNKPVRADAPAERSSWRRGRRCVFMEIGYSMSNGGRHCGVGTGRQRPSRLPKANPAAAVRATAV